MTIEDPITADATLWQRALGLVEATYRATEALPSLERDRLGARLRESAVEIPSHLAEDSEGGPGGPSTPGRSWLDAHEAVRRLEGAVGVCGRLSLLRREQVDALERRAAELGRGLLTRVACPVSAPRG